MEPENTAFDVARIREDFPALHQEVNGVPLAYLDNAATTQRPRQVIEAVKSFYEEDNANVHRGVHALSVRATEKMEAARAKVARFLHAKGPQECVFVRGTTEAVNLVANSYVAPMLQEGDEIIISHMEHHSNIVPWQLICQRTGAVLRVAPINYDGEIIVDAFEELFNDRTRFVSLNYVSNAIGTINPVKALIKIAHDRGVRVMLDGAQASAHIPINVQDLDCDFYALSGHKMYGPTGIGVLWGKDELLNTMIPYQGGGEMISFVTFSSTQYAAVPHKFEAGTPNIAGIIGLGAAIDYLGGLNVAAIASYEQDLLHYATESLKALGDYSVIGTAQQKVSILSFIHRNIHSHDIGTILDTDGVAVRSGHHCAMPLMEFFELAATSRIALSFYNTKEEVDRCMQSLQKVKEVFG